MSGPGEGPPPDPWRYRLRIPPLDIARYHRASAALLRPLARGRGWRRLGIGLAIGCVAGGLAGYGLSSAGVGMDLALYADRPAFDVVLTGLEAALVLTALALLGFAALVFLTVVRNARVVRSVHATTRSLNTANHLLLGEDGLEWRTPDSSLAVCWGGVAALVPDGDTHYLRLDGLAFLWLPDAALGEPLRRAEIIAFIAERIARAKPA